MLNGSRGRDKARRGCEVAIRAWVHRPSVKACHSCPIKTASLSCLFGLFSLFNLSRFWLNETNQLNQTNQIDKMNQTDETDQIGQNSFSAAC